MQGREYGRPRFGGCALRHIFRAHHLKRQRDPRHQHQDRVNHSRVCESGGSEKPRRDYVVKEVCDSDQSGACQQRKTSAKELGLRCLGRR
jgi:hypothetical protein